MLIPYGLGPAGILSFLARILHGVSLSLRTAAVAHASIAQNGSSLSVAPLPAIRDAQWRGGVADGSEQWHTVELIYTDGVSVLLDGRPLFASVPLASRLLPRRSWRVAVSAKCGDRHDAHWVSSIDLERGAAVRFGDAAVRLSADGSHFASDAATFRYYRPPIVSSMTPSCGPRAGGTHVTIRGDGLAAGAGPFLCGWGACGWCDASPPASPSLSNCRCENVTHATWDAAAREMRCLTPELRGDEEVCLAAVTNDGRALRYCSTAARDDPRICRAACATYGLALQYASRRCRNDEDVVYVRLRLKLTLPFATSLLKPLTRRSLRSDLAQQQGAPRCSSTVSHSPTRPEPSVATSRRCS